MNAWDLFAVGHTETLGDHTFTADEIKRFAERYDPQPFHVDGAKAKASVLGGLCASGWHTTAVYMRLNIDSRARQAKNLLEDGGRLPEMGASPGFTNLRWPRPVYAGDTVRFTQTVKLKRKSESRPGWGIVEFGVHAENQDGQAVLSFDGAVFCPTDETD